MQPPPDQSPACPHQLQGLARPQDGDGLRRAAGETAPCEHGQGQLPPGAPPPPTLPICPPFWPPALLRCRPAGPAAVWGGGGAGGSGQAGCGRHVDWARHCGATRGGSGGRGRAAADQQLGMPALSLHLCVAPHLVASAVVTGRRPKNNASSRQRRRALRGPRTRGVQSHRQAACFGGLQGRATQQEGRECGAAPLGGVLPAQRLSGVKGAGYEWVGECQINALLWYNKLRGRAGPTARPAAQAAPRAGPARPARHGTPFQHTAG